MDYLIISSNLFSVIKNFHVLDYDPLFSDVHCALQFSFSVYYQQKTEIFLSQLIGITVRKMSLLNISLLIKNNEIENIVNRIDDMLLLQDVSIIDVNEIEKKSWEYFQAYFC